MKKLPTRLSLFPAFDNSGILLRATSLLLAVSMVGCASFNDVRDPSESALQTETANQLGYNPNQIKISNIHAKSSGGGSGTTYYLADTPKGRYACNTASGTLVAIVSFGTSAGVSCEKQ